MNRVVAIALIFLPSIVLAQDATPPLYHYRNLLSVNPVHLANGNVTLTFERFTSDQRSFRIILSGGRKDNYVLVAADLNYYPSPRASINWFVGGSLIVYESPIVTGVPITQPWNRFSESGDDRYYVATQLKNGALFRLREFLSLGIDLGIGPALEVTNGSWLWVWSIGLNLGIPF